MAVMQIFDGCRRSSDLARTKGLLQPSKIWFPPTLCKFQWLQKTFCNHPMVTENLLQPLKYGNRCGNRNRIPAFFTHINIYHPLSEASEGYVFVDVCLFTGGGVCLPGKVCPWGVGGVGARTRHLSPQRPDTLPLPPPTRHLPPRTTHLPPLPRPGTYPTPPHPTPQARSMRGRYASYWTAYLFYLTL